MAERGCLGARSFGLACGAGHSCCCVTARSAVYSFTEPGEFSVLFSTMFCFSFLAKVSFLRRKTNITQAPGQDTPRCVTLGGLHTAAERIQPAEQEQRPGEGVGVRGVVSWRGERAGQDFVMSNIIVVQPLPYKLLCGAGLKVLTTQARP